MMGKCFIGWPDGSQGRCCCNCVNQVLVRSHPWNQMVGGRMKGPISNIAGFGCRAMVDGSIIFNEHKHGMCEEHSWKRKRKDING